MTTGNVEDVVGDAHDGGVGIDGWTTEEHVVVNVDLGPSGWIWNGCCGLIFGVATLGGG